MAAVCILALLLVPACGREAETGPSIDEVLPFDDAEVEVVEFWYNRFVQVGNGTQRKSHLLITGQEDIDYILSTLRALEPIGYNTDRGVVSGGGTEAVFTFHMRDARLYTVYYNPGVTSVANAASLESDVARILVPYDEDFLYGLALLDYQNLWRPGGGRDPVPDLGYSDPGDAPMEWYPYL